MKTKILLVLSSMMMFAFFGTTHATSPMHITYGTQFEFEKSPESRSCLVATDGCNEYTVDQNGKVTAGTLKYCMDTEEAWYCVRQRPTQTICTQEYAPVCGKDGKDYGNACMAEAVGIAHEGMCNSTDKSPLSQSDMNLYYHLRSELPSSYVKKVDAAVDQYADRMNKLRWSEEKKRMTINAKVDQIDGYIYNLISRYPADAALPANVNDKYQKLSLIKLELMMIE